MADSTVKQRQTGAKATLGRSGFPHIVTPTGGELVIKTGVSEAGFNPVDLLYASLSACLAMSARIAASRLGVIEKLVSVSADVTGDKGADEPSRIATLHITLHIEGDFDTATRQAIAETAEHICTVSNTIRFRPDFKLVVTGG